MGVHLPSAGPPGWGPQRGAQTTHASGGTSKVVISLLLTGHCTRKVGSDETESQPLLPISVWPSLYILSCRRSVLLVFRLFSQIVVLYILVVLVCPWEEGNSESFYSTIIIPTNAEKLCKCCCFWNASLDMARFF